MGCGIWVWGFLRWGDVALTCVRDGFFFGLRGWRSWVCAYGCGVGRLCEFAWSRAAIPACTHFFFLKTHTHPCSDLTVYCHPPALSANATHCPPNSSTPVAHAAPVECQSTPAGRDERFRRARGTGKVRRLTTSVGPAPAHTTPPICANWAARPTRNHVHCGDRQRQGQAVY